MDWRSMSRGGPPEPEPAELAIIGGGGGPGGGGGGILNYLVT